MEITRRDFLRASSAIAAAWGLNQSEWAAGATTSGPSVVWLQGQSCSGCSVSFLNSISVDSAENVLTNTLNVQYHPTLMAAAGAGAIAVAQAAKNTTGYILVVEGGIPTGASGKYAYLWPGLTVLQGVQDYALNAKYVIAAGTCPSFGCIASGKPNPTTVTPLSSIIGTTKLINIPGCPLHPDWLVGTVAYILKNGALPALDSNRRPTMYYGRTVHDQCPYEEREQYCLRPYGCKGPRTHADCPRRKWNAVATGGTGINWCIGAGRPNGTPCLGCTEPGFPDAMSPFYVQPTTSHTSSIAPNSSAAPSPDATVQAQPLDATAPQPAASVSDANSTPGGSTSYQQLQQQKRAAHEQLMQRRRQQYEQRKLDLRTNHQ